MCLSEGVVAAICTHPFDVIKTRLQVSHHAEALSLVVPPSVSSGSGRASSSSKGAFTVCCEMAECCCPCTGRPLAVLPATAAQNGGPSSGACETAGGSSSAETVSSRARRSLRQDLLDIVRSRGLRGLYTGLAMRLATIVPGSGIMITVYEFAKTF